MLAYTIRGSIKDADDFKAVASELSEQVEAGEPGTQAYQWFLSRDGSSGMLYEQFENTEALLTHFGNVTPVTPTAWVMTTCLLSMRIARACSGSER